MYRLMRGWCVAFSSPRSRQVETAGLAQSFCVCVCVCVCKFSLKEGVTLLAHPWVSTCVPANSPAPSLGNSGCPQASACILVSCAEPAELTPPPPQELRWASTVRATEHRSVKPS